MRHIEKIPYLLEGIWVCFKTSSGFRLHLAFDILFFCLAGLFGISQVGWLLLVVMTTLKASLELGNSAIEELVEKLWPRERGDNSKAKLVKDYAGAVVFVSIIGSVAIWLILFIPEFAGLVV